MNKPTEPESVVGEIKRKTRRKFSSEEKIRIALEGLRGEESIAALCRREGISPNLYYNWSKEFLEAGKRRLKRVYENTRPPAARRWSYAGRTHSLSRWWRSCYWRSAGRYIFRKRIVSVVE